MLRGDGEVSACFANGLSFSCEYPNHEEELIVVASLNSADDPFLSKQQQHMFTFIHSFSRYFN